MSESPEGIGNRLALARSKGGLSARELDRLAGKTEGHASLIEARRTGDVLASNVAAYAAVLGVTTDWLILGHGPAPSDDEVRIAVERARTAHESAEQSSQSGT